MLMKTTSAELTRVLDGATTLFQEQLPIHLSWIIPLILLVVFGIVFAVRKREDNIENDPARKAAKEELEEAKRAKKEIRTFRPPISNYFRIIDSVPKFFVKSCIYGCCCLLWNIAFYIILGVVVFPIWLIIRVFIFVRIHDDKIQVKGVFSEKIIIFDDIVNITIQGTEVHRTVDTYRNFIRVSSRTIGDSGQPHSIKLLFKTSSQALVLVDLNRYTFNKGLEILEVLVEKLEAKPNISSVILENQLLRINRINLHVENEVKKKHQKAKEVISTDEPLEVDQELDLEDFELKLLGTDRMEKEQAIRELGKIGTQARKAIPILTEIFEKEDDQLQKEIIRTFGKIGVGAEDSLPILIEVLESKDHLARKEAIKAISNLGEKSVVALPALKSIFENKKEDPLIRREIIVALGKMRPLKEEIDSIIIQSLQDEDEWIRFHVLEILDMN